MVHTMMNRSESLGSALGSAHSLFPPVLCFTPAVNWFILAAGGHTLTQRGVAEKNFELSSNRRWSTFENTESSPDPKCCEGASSPQPPHRLPAWVTHLAGSHVFM